MPRTAPTGANKAADFAAAFAKLKTLLVPYDGKAQLVHDKPVVYYLDMRGKTYKGKPVFFASVRLGRGYVSYHLFPLYTCPDLAKGLSTALKKRMQGKTCFNFVAAPEPALLAELKKLTATGYTRLRAVDLPP
jgi:hypothetical protein